DGSSWSSFWFSPAGATYFNTGDSLTLKVTDTAVLVFKNDQLFRSVSNTYSGSLNELKVFVQFRGPNDAASISLDDIGVCGL
ncbi:MAG: hypothetical protein ACF8OB_12895, partial [Phycisphaeraceae bacterium JB051]